MIASLPMYGIDRPAVERFWAGLGAAIRRRGLDAPEQLTWPETGLEAHWRAPNLLISQACGYPLVEGISRDVRVVGAFQFAVEGCRGTDYASRLVARSERAGDDIAAFRGTVAAYNGANSQSGYNALRATVAPHAESGRFFAATIESGSHRRSLDLVRTGAADIAAIDCISLALIERFEPEAVAGLTGIGWTPPAPGLPLVTSALTSRADLERLRLSVEEAVADPELAEARTALFISRFSRLDLADYARCTAMKRSAERLGYPALA